jgi:hypothetical protein
VFQSNKDWWNVRTVSGQDGFAPATYLKEVEPKLVQVRASGTNVMILEHFLPKILPVFFNLKYCICVQKIEHKYLKRFFC